MRHGRKNRKLLRAWKASAGEGSLAAAETDPLSGRPRKLARYSNRDLLVMTGGNRWQPLLEWIAYDEIVLRNLARSGPWVSPRLTKRLGRDPSIEQRCWLSGVQLYFVPGSFLKESAPPPWAMSREHLVCTRNNGLGHGDSNIVIVGACINKKIGHIPLPLKMHHRQELAQHNYGRDAPSWFTYHAIRQILIDTENQYRLGAAYPWQPWAFPPGTRDHRIATAFFEEMRDAEQEFLSLDPAGRRQWLDEFRWRW